MKNKIGYLLSIMVLLTALVLIGYFIYSIVYPFRTVEYSNVPFKILNANKQVRIGEEILFEVDYCRYTETPTEVSRSLVDDVIYLLPSIIVNNPLGCYKSTTSVLVPKAVAPGTYVVLSTLSWRINAFRSITQQTTTEKFVVVP
jgi:hypothetical protein